MTCNALFRYDWHMDISVTIYSIDLTFSACTVKVPLEGRLSQISYLGPSFYFMTKNGIFFFKAMKVSDEDAICTCHFACTESEVVFQIFSDNG